MRVATNLESEHQEKQPSFPCWCCSLEDMMPELLHLSQDPVGVAKGETHMVAEQKDGRVCIPKDRWHHLTSHLPTATHTGGSHRLHRAACDLPSEL